MKNTEDQEQQTLVPDPEVQLEPLEVKYVDSSKINKAWAKVSLNFDIQSQEKITPRQAVDYIKGLVVGAHEVDGKTLMIGLQDNAKFVFHKAKNT